MEHEQEGDEKDIAVVLQSKKTTSNSKEKVYRLPIKHGRNQAHLTEKDETQSYQFRERKLHREQEEKKEVIYDIDFPSTDKMKEDDHAAQSLQPTVKGTECKVHHRPSLFRRIMKIWRKRKTSRAPGYDPEMEIVREQVLKEVNEQGRAEGKLSAMKFPRVCFKEQEEKRHIST